MVVSEFSECDFRNVPAASEVIDSESFGLALGLPADCADARSSSWPSSSEHKLRNGDDSGVAGSVCGVLGEGDDGLLCMLRRQARPSRGAAKLDSTKQKRLGDCGCTALPGFAGWRGRELGSGDCGNAGNVACVDGTCSREHQSGHEQFQNMTRHAFLCIGAEDHVVNSCLLRHAPRTCTIVQLRACVLDEISLSACNIFERQHRHTNCAARNASSSMVY